MTACRMPSGEKEDVVWRTLLEGGDREKQNDARESTGAKIHEAL